MSLVAWYPLNGDLKNLGLSDYNIVEKTIQYADGKLGQAANFLRNSNSTLGIQNSPIKTAVFSVSGWLYSGDTTNNYGCWLCCRKSTGKGFSIFRTPENKLRLDILGSQWITDYIVPIDQWFHLIVTFDNGLVKYYINGELKQTETETSYSIEQLGTVMTIGSSNINALTGNNHWYGKMNDIKIFDHCLSKVEVKEVYKTPILKYTFDYPFVSQNISTPSIETIDGVLDMSSKLTGTDNSCINIGVIINNKNYITLDNYITLSFDIEIENLSVVEGRTSGTMMLQANSKNSEGTTLWNNIITNNDLEKKTRYFLSEAGDRDINLSIDGKYHISRTYKIGQDTLTSVSNWIVQIRTNYIVGGKAKVSNFRVVLGKYEQNFDGTDGIIYDESGYGNNGEIVASSEDSKVTSYSQDSAIGMGCYLSKKINESGENVYTAIQTKDVFPAIPEFTLSFWINLKDYATETGSVSDTFIGCAESQDKWGIWIRHSYDRLYVTLYTKTIDTTGIKLDLDRWYNIVVTAQNEGKGRVYIDGELVVEESISSGVDWGNAKFTIGDLKKDRGLSFNGRIDDIRMYASVLDGKEIKKMYLNREKVDVDGNLYCGEINEAKEYREYIENNVGRLKYIKLDYIEALGEQYIDTGVKPTKDIAIQVKYFVSDYTQERNYIFGTYTNNGQKNRYQFTHTSESNNYLFGFGSTTKKRN